MKTIPLLTLLTAFINVSVEAQTSKNEYTGFFEQNSTWVSGTAPATPSSGTITTSGKTMVIDGLVKSKYNLVLTNFVLTPSNLTINAGDTLVVLGNLSINGASTLTNNGLLVVYGDINNPVLSTYKTTGTGSMVVTGNYNGILGSNTFTGPSYVYGTHTGVGGVSNEAALTSANPGLHTWVGDMYTTLPIQLVFFNAFKDNNGVTLKWQTASELNNDHFIIDRSSDGEHFKTISKITGAGTSNKVIDYNFNDENPLVGTSYYRLSQVDLDGAISQFNVVSVSRSEEQSIEIFPNPTIDYLFLSGVKESALVLIQDLRGGHDSRQFEVKELAPGKLGIDVTTIEEGAYCLKFPSINFGSAIRFVKR